MAEDIGAAEVDEAEGQSAETFERLDRRNKDGQQKTSLIQKSV